MRTILLAALLTGLFLVPRHPACAQGELTAPSEALISVDYAAGWSTGFGLRFDTRAMKGPDEVEEDVDFRDIGLRLGATPAPWLHAYADLAYSQATWLEDEGDGGFGWGIGLRVHLLEYVLRSSPVVGKKEVVILAVNAAYHQASSEGDTETMDWAEILVEPQVMYVVNRRGEPYWRSFQNNGYALRLGLAYSGLDAERGGVDFEASQEVGGMIGADLRWDSGWIVQLKATLYGTDDHSIGLATVYHF